MKNMYNTKGIKMSKNIMNKNIKDLVSIATSDLINIDNLTDEAKKLGFSKKRLHQIKDCYVVKEHPEEKEYYREEIFNNMENAIYSNSYINLEYQFSKSIKTIKCKPYKIIIINEIFYLGCETNDLKSKFSLFRVSKIHNIEITTERFTKNQDMVDFINFIQTPFSKYTENFRENLIDVQLEVDKTKAYFFISKNFLPTQKIEYIKDNGNLVVSYKVTQMLEIDDLLSTWNSNIKLLNKKG
jgi:predicted DNA-binding transcriptional regulator YafY